MRRSTHSELKKLRELVSHFLEGEKCYFCHKPLQEVKEYRPLTFGNAAGPKLVERLTIHHIDGDHDNNVKTNRAPCHESCHKRHHIKMRRNPGPIVWL